jgi:quercetin dioxygenase-like cupin family protein
MMAGALLAGGCQSFVSRDAQDGRKRMGANVAHSTQVPFDDIVWDVQPNGRTLANIKGDFKTGPHTKIIKFSADQKTAPHTHSYGYVGVIVKGVAKHFEPGKPETEKVLPAGSFWKVPAGVVHISECLPQQGCIFVTQQEGFFDVQAAPLMAGG